MKVTIIGFSLNNRNCPGDGTIQSYVVVNGSVQAIVLLSDGQIGSIPLSYLKQDKDGL